MANLAPIAKFQFLLVRLKEVEGFNLVSGGTQFQFLLVRLKVYASH